MARKLRDCERGWVPGSLVPHLLFMGENTFCSKRVSAAAVDTRFEEVCPRCISTAKHMGLREH